MSLARDATKGQSAYRIALFDTFYIVGGLLVLANLLTAWLSPHINRASTWTMFHFSWFLTAVVNLLLLGQQTGPEPNKALCLVQSMFIYAAPVLYVGMGAVSFIIAKSVSRSSLSGVSFMLHVCTFSSLRLGLTDFRCFYLFYILSKDKLRYLQIAFVL